MVCDDSQLVNGHIVFCATFGASFSWFLLQAQVDS